MSKRHAPRHGTLQFWPRRRAKREAARIRQWPQQKDAKPLGFLGYKAGMCHVIAIDNRPKSPSKGEDLALPATIIECPPLQVAAVNFYRHTISGPQLAATIFSPAPDKELSRVLPLPKKVRKKLEDMAEFDDLRLLVHTQPGATGIGTKKPKLAELAVGGTKEQKLSYAKEKLGREIRVDEVFREGAAVDIHAITKGKGFQGPVKRHGVMLRHHKSEKARRANVRGSWTGPKMWTAPHSAKMGYNQRTEYNKWILRLGTAAKDINPSGGILHYGLIRNPYMLVKGSVSGPCKRVMTLTQPIRPNKNIPKEAPAIRTVVL